MNRRVQNTRKVSGKPSGPRSHAISGRRVAVPKFALAAGLVATALAGAAGSASEAFAQGAVGDSPFSSPSQPTVSNAPRPARPAPTAPIEPVPSTVAEQPSDQLADPAANPSADPADAPPPRLRRGRAPVVDGDPNFPPERVQPVDGVINNDEPMDPVDGGDTSQLDTRDPEDIAAFERPAAGFDPDLFIAEIEPILDRRPARLARFEPFQPTGVRVGSFIVLPEAEIGGIGYSNLFRSGSNPRRDVAIDFRPSVRVVSNWNRHALEFRATGFSTFHKQFPGEDDRAYLVEARGRIDLTRRTNFEALVGQERTQELRGSINAVSAGTRASVDTTRGAVALNQRFNRLTIQVRGTLTDTTVGSVTSSTGALVSNAARDNVFKEAAVRATWAFKPTFGVFSEVAVNQRTYQQAPADGISRDSSGERVRAGISFGNTSQTLRGEVAVGYAEQRFEQSRLLPVSGAIFDANLGWRITPLTSLLLTARTAILETTALAGVGGGLTHVAGLELRHAFQRRLLGTAAVLLTKTDYQGIVLHDTNLTSSLGLEYFFNREVTVFGRFQHVDFESTDQTRNYNADEVRVGVKVRL